MNLNSRMTRRTGLGLAASAVAALAVGKVAAQDATPPASPVAASPFPAGPLGDHAMWFVETLNAGPGKVTTAQINEHFSLVFFETTPMSTIFKELSDLQSSGITWEVDPASVTSSTDTPSTATSFILIGSDGSETEVAMTLDPETELIATLVWGPVGTLGGTPEASPVS